MIATLVATNGHWGAYVATQEMLEKKEPPHFISKVIKTDPILSNLIPLERPSEVTEAINKQYPEQFTGYTDYGDFWQQIAYAGIEKPDVMPHREPYTKEDWQKGRLKTCNICNKEV